jgi:hypothetical protein
MRRWTGWTAWAALMTAVLLTLAGCAQIYEQRQGPELRVYERRADGSITSATLTGVHPGIIGEHLTSATLTMPSGLQAGLYDKKSKDTMEILGSAAIGAVAGWLMP